MVKCAECGFLAMRQVVTRKLLDAELETRKNGSIQIQGNSHLYDEVPVCFAMVLDFSKSMPNPDRDSRNNAIQTDRNCEKFIVWRQGFTPKEHQEMLDRQWMMEQAAARELSEREWKESQAAKAERHSNRSLFVAVAGIIVAAVINMVGLFIKSQPVPAASMPAEPAVTVPAP